MRLTRSALIVSTLALATLTMATGANAAPEPAGARLTSAVTQDPTPESISDLRQEIDRLRLELEKKQADLAAALQRIKALETGTAADPAPTTKPTPATATSPAKSTAPTTPAKPLVNLMPPAPMPQPIPADPTIGPGGLMASMQADYLAAYPTVPNADNTKLLTNHLRGLANWCTKANRDNTKQHIWVGRVDQGTIQTNGKNVSFMATFVNSNRYFTVPITVDQSVIARIRTRNGIEPGDLAFSGIVTPRVRVNSARPAPSAFETPYMLAPYVEFFFSFNVKSIVPAAGPSR
jgi:uncharacterized coiled-coil protein SlyX